ncbi:MAG: hypothetical protein QOJ25_1331 [Solirubrobacteraceae bacterium]|nr:hypothetical protein [Solirubrobacteraceae bacterium]
MTRQTITERLAAGGGRRRQAAAAAGTIVVVAVVIGIVVSAGDPAASKGQNSNAASSGSTTVQRRNLVETDTESGTLGYANAQTVFNRLSGTVTFLPKVGQVVSPGGTLYQVNGYPVILFNGSYPAYRNLSSSDSNGRDIEELNADLRAMGFDPYDAITVDNAWQDGTTAAVDRFQASIGQTETGKLTLGQIVFLPGSQLINAVDTTIGSTGGSAAAGSGSPSSGASYSPPARTPERVSYDSPTPPHAQFVDFSTATKTPALTTPTTTTPATTTPATTTPATTAPATTAPATTTPTTTPTTTTPMSSTPGTSSSGLQAIIQLLQTQNRLLEAELKAAAKGSGNKSPSGTTGAKTPSAASTGSSKPSSSANSPSSSANNGSGSGGGGGGGGGSATAILSTTSTNLVVTVQLDATKQSEAKLGEPVTVQLPDGSTVNGRVTSVSSVATTTNTGSNSNSPSNSAPSATIPVTISLDKHADTRGLDQAAVSVNFDAQVANHVLSVPVTALLATQGGGYAVQLAAPPHKLVAVTPGLFAAGYVQISGPGIQDGMQVTDSQG